MNYKKIIKIGFLEIYFMWIFITKNKNFIIKICNKNFLYKIRHKK